MPRCNTAFCISQLPRGQSNPKKLLHPRGKPCRQKNIKNNRRSGRGFPLLQQLFCITGFTGTRHAVRYLRRGSVCTGNHVATFLNYAANAKTRVGCLLWPPMRVFATILRHAAAFGPCPAALAV